MKLKIAMGVTLVAYVFGFFTLQVLAKDKTFSELENRDLASAPKLSKEAFLNGSFGEDFEKYIADQFPLRNKFISLKAYSELALQKTDNNGVFIGKGGYFLQDFTKPDTVLMDKNSAYINEFAKKFNVYMMLSPTSTKVLEYKLPSYATPYDEGTYIRNFYKQLSTKVHKVNVLDTLLDKNTEDIYYKTDHHWTTLGAYYAYTAFAKSAGFTPLSLSDFNIIDANSEFYGTLFSKGNFTFAKPDTIQIFEPKQKVDVEVKYVSSNTTTNSLYAYSHLDTKDKYSVFLDGNHPLITIKTGVKNGKKLLVIKDSYANSLVPFLTNHYEEIHIMDLRLLNMPITTYATQNGIKDVLFLYNVHGFNTEAKYSLLGK